MNFNNVLNVIKKSPSWLLVLAHTGFVLAVTIFELLALQITKAGGWSYLFVFLIDLPVMPLIFLTEPLLPRGQNLYIQSFIGIIPMLFFGGVQWFLVGKLIDWLYEKSRNKCN